jgi:CheY-like chemotaxis protein
MQNSNTFDAPILVADDDPDDRLIIQEICKNLRISNEIIFFENGRQLLDYLCSTNKPPFIIVCDINMPVMSGLELRKIINADDALRKRAIPFIFLSTSTTPTDVEKAYELTVQGYFGKSDDMKKLERQISLIFEYWKECRHPNSGLTQRTQAANASLNTPIGES